MALLLGNKTVIRSMTTEAPIFGTASQLESWNPILQLYQLGKEVDAYYLNGQNKEKIGDGITEYNLLPYTVIEYKEISFTGAVDGINTIFTLSKSATNIDVISDTQTLILGLGYTVLGLVYTLTYPPVNGIVFKGNY